MSTFFKITPSTLTTAGDALQTAGADVGGERNALTAPGSLAAPRLSAAALEHFEGQWSSWAEAMGRAVDSIGAGVAGAAAVHEETDTAASGGFGSIL